MDNPFSLVPYVSKELFCDRENETKTIFEYLMNGSNITLISPRSLWQQLSLDADTLSLHL